VNKGKTMHIIIGIITAVAGLIWALVSLQRAGFNLSSLDPFALYRRLIWKKKYRAKPLYNMQNPMDVAAVLILGVAKCEGEISIEQKQAIQAIFVNEFKLSDSEASDLLVASSYLLRDEVYIVDKLDKVLEKSKSYFNQEQIDSTLELMKQVSRICNETNEEQAKLIARAQKILSPKKEEQSKW